MNENNESLSSSLRRSESPGTDITRIVDQLENRGEDFINGLLGSATGVDYDATDVWALGDCVVATTFYRALESIIAIKHRNTQNTETNTSNNRILIKPQTLQLFERGNRTVSPAFSPADEASREDQRIAFEWHYAIGVFGGERAVNKKDPGKFTMFQRFKTDQGGYATSVEYSAAMKAATFDKYGDDRFRNAALLALGIPENLWKHFPSIVPEVLSPDEEELQEAKAKFKIDSNAINIGIVVNSAMDVKMISLGDWLSHLTTLEAALKDAGHDFKKTPLHVNFFYNPGTPSAFDHSEESLQEYFGGQIGEFMKVNYIGANLSELPAALQLQDAMESVDTALAHIATALPEGPEVAMIFNQKTTPSSLWQSSSKQHPIDITNHDDGSMEQIVIDSLKRKGKLHE